MGVEQSQSSHSGYLYIETPNGFFRAGSELQGSVHLYLTQPVHAVELVLKFKTKEKWIINPNPNGTYRQFKHMIIRPQLFAEKTTISQRFPIFRFFEEVTGPGQFSFPFTLKLHENTPGSCTLDDHICIGNITNLLIASVTSTGETVRKYSLPLSIMQSFSQSLSSENTFAVSLGCCRGSGEVALSVTVDKGSYLPGEEIEISVGIDNSEGCVPIGSVTVGLYRTVDVAMDQGAAYVRKSTEKEMVMRKRIPVGQALMAERKVHLRFPVNINSETVSTKGYIMQCFYTIAVCAQLEKGWIMSSESPVLSHRIVIQPVEPVFLAPPAIPVPWNPETLPVTLLSLGDNYDEAIAR